ncbi:MAG: FkbM family methyltransferase [Ferruginibacter sp.]
MLWFTLRYGIYPCKTIDGITIPVYLKYGYSVLRFINNGEYEKSEISIIKNTLTNKDKVLELGTGIGFVSAYCAKSIGSENIFTYDGNPSLAPFIKQLYLANDVSPTATPAILGSTNGTRTFYKNNRSFLTSSADDDSSENSVAISVEEQNLNEVIDRLQPTYLIMDIEGGEYNVFKMIDFQSIQKIQFELHPAILDKGQVDFIFKKLEKEKFIMNASFQFSNNFFFQRENK